MRPLYSRAAVVSLVLPDGRISEPAIYVIELPTEDGQPISDEAALTTIIGNLWVAVGDRIMVAEVVKVPTDSDESLELRPVRKVSAATMKGSPMRLERSMFDPDHSNFEEFHKYYCTTRGNIIWKLHLHASQGHDGYLLRRDGSMLPYSNIRDQIASMSDRLAQLKGLGSEPSTLLDSTSTPDGRRDVDMGIDPMKTVGVPPHRYEKEPEPQTDIQKKPGSRARSAGVKVKAEVLASSPTKAPPSRRGRPPASPSKAAASSPTTPKRAASPRKPASRASPKKAASVKPVSASAAMPTRRPPASAAVPMRRPPASTSSQPKPHFAVAPLSLARASTKPVSAPAPSRGSPVRLTRSATRERSVALPPTPPLPERRIVAARTAAPPSTSPGYQVAAQTVAAGSGPVYAPYASQAVAGPSSVPLECVPEAGYPTGQSAYASGFAQAFHHWPLPVLVPAAWVQPPPASAPAEAQSSDKMVED